MSTDKDGKISAAEFKTGCGKGWIQSADASTTKEMTPAPNL
jgi:major membrane immunogen (membrane-anchored lipoprotein)